MCSDMKDYSIQIDPEYYDNDYDLVDIENQSEISEEQDSNILFE